ncbi:MAG: hypothetical protein M3Y69_10825 [Verrucomicrobiota bacterium]|nr:hypothetical protein [Verrucomicrobiota bacterium]
MRSNFLLLAACGLLAFGGLTSCQTTSPAHQFAEPKSPWQTRTGQLAYTGPHMSLIGEVLVRYTNAGDFELTFSKGPGVALLSLRSDANFAQAEGPLARGRWSGQVAAIPERLRGWFALREKILAARGKSNVTYTAGAETFNLRF